jgi:hypothetical protein
LDQSWRELLRILTEAVNDLDADRLSEESFDSVRAIIEIGMEVTKERRALLISANSATGVADGVAPVAGLSVR